MQGRIFIRPSLFLCALCALRGENSFLFFRRQIRDCREIRLNLKGLIKIDLMLPDGLMHGGEPARECVIGDTPQIRPHPPFEPIQEDARIVPHDIVMDLLIDTPPPLRLSEGIVLIACDAHVRRARRSYGLFHASHSSRSTGFSCPASPDRKPVISRPPGRSTRAASRSASCQVGIR